MVGVYLAFEVYVSRAANWRAEVVSKEAKVDRIRGGMLDLPCIHRPLACIPLGSGIYT